MSGDLDGGGEGLSEEKPLTDAELADIEALAQRLGEGRSEYGRALHERWSLCGHYGKFSPDSDQLGAETILARMVAEIRRMRGLLQRVLIETSPDDLGRCWWCNEDKCPAGCLRVALEAEVKG